MKKIRSYFELTKPGVRRIYTRSEVQEALAFDDKQMDRAFSGLVNPDEISAMTLINLINRGRIPKTERLICLLVEEDE